MFDKDVALRFSREVNIVVEKEAERIELWIYCGSEQRRWCSVWRRLPSA